MFSKTSLIIDWFFSSKANSFNSCKSDKDVTELLYVFIKSSYNFFSLIIFCDFDLSCQKLFSRIF